ncbi:MAG: hypothetical protein FWE20_11970 [Defluviitaleaceae bacterium]|nr:hypothetical protein [Defluviitaleaceae bacterium]
MIMQNVKARTTLLLFFGLLLPSVLFAQEQLTFVAVRDTFAVNQNTRETILIQTGDTISTSEVIFGQLTLQGQTNFHLLMLFGESRRNEGLSVFAKDFLPANTEDVFGNDIFIDFPLEPFKSDLTERMYDDIDSMWVPAYYNNVLIGQDRDILLEMFPWLIELNNSDWYWYDRSSYIIRTDRSMFYNSVITLGGYGGETFAVRNIKKTDFGYIVNAIVSTYGYEFLTRPEIPDASLAPFWRSYWLGDRVTLLLYLDGDYLDIYTYGTDIHVGTFIRVGREFIAQYQSLIRTNTSDLTNVVYPQRADGSTGIRPRITLADDTLLEAEAAPVAAPAEEAAAAIKTTPLIFAAEAPPIAEESAPATGALPPWAWLAIGGGALAIAGGAFVARRKR